MARVIGAQARTLSRASLERALPAGETLLLDTSVLIAYLDREDQANAAAVAVVDGLVREGRNPALISMVTVTEVLVGPARAGDHELYALILELLTQLPGLRLREIDFRVAERAATLRARHQLRTADALIVATGLVAGVGRIVTNDRQWSTRLTDTAVAAPIVLVADHLPLA